MSMSLSKSMPTPKSMPMQKPYTRRKFLQKASVVGFPLFLPRLSSANSALTRLNHACIGANGMGWSDMNSLASHNDIQIVAICDVDTARMQKAAQKFPDARRYQDWRELLDAEGDKIDSVNVTVPDHMHAPISMSAIHRGKHVYCQKPLTHEIAEARALRLAAEEAGVVTQMGNQIQSAAVYRLATQIVKDGTIGAIREIHAWTGATFPQRGRPAGEDPVPATLDWDKWIGVAPPRPFKTDTYHPFRWRGWQDFGCGPIGDFGCHILDTPFKSVGLTAPISIRATAPQDWADTEAWNTENWPDWEVFEYLFPGTEQTAGKTIKVMWYDGGKKPPRELAGFSDSRRRLPGSGALFLGEEGQMLLPHVGSPELFPQEKFDGWKRPDVKGFSHYHAFIDACLGRGETGSSFRYAGPLTEASLLGTVAVRFPGQTLEWNTTSMCVTNHEGANRLVKRKYRSGWEVRGLG